MSPPISIPLVTYTRSAVTLTNSQPLNKNQPFVKVLSPVLEFISKPYTNPAFRDKVVELVCKSFENPQNEKYLPFLFHGDGLILFKNILESSSEVVVQNGLTLLLHLFLGQKDECLIQLQLSELIQVLIKLVCSEKFVDNVCNLFRQFMNLSNSLVVRNFYLHSGILDTLTECVCRKLQGHTGDPEIARAELDTLEAFQSRMSGLDDAIPSTPAESGLSQVHKSSCVN